MASLQEPPVQPGPTPGADVSSFEKGCFRAGTFFLEELFPRYQKFGAYNQSIAFISLTAQTRRKGSVAAAVATLGAEGA